MWDPKKLSLEVWTLVIYSLIFKLHYIFRDHYCFLTMFLWYYSRMCAFRTCCSVCTLLLIFLLLWFYITCSLISCLVYFFSSNWTARKVFNIAFENFDMMSIIWYFFIPFLYQFFMLNCFFLSYLTRLLGSKIVVTYGI